MSEFLLAHARLLRYPTAGPTQKQAPCMEHHSSRRKVASADRGEITCITTLIWSRPGPLSIPLRSVP